MLDGGQGRGRGYFTCCFPHRNPRKLGYISLSSFLPVVISSHTLGLRVLSYSLVTFPCKLSEGWLFVLSLNNVKSLYVFCLCSICVMFVYTSFFYFSFHSTAPPLMLLFLIFFLIYLRLLSLSFIHSLHPTLLDLFSPSFLQSLPLHNLLFLFYSLLPSDVPFRFPLVLHLYLFFIFVPFISTPSSLSLFLYRTLHPSLLCLSPLSVLRNLI